MSKNKVLNIISSLLLSFGLLVVLFAEIIEFCTNDGIKIDLAHMTGLGIIGLLGLALVSFTTILNKGKWVLFGALLITIGLLLPVPGTALTTMSILNGQTTTGYTFGNKYSAIDEYVGGDAYNFIIGAVLVGSKIAGTMSMKGIFMVGGAICVAFGIAFMLYQPAPKFDNISYSATQAENEIVKPENHTEMSEPANSTEESA